VIIKEDQSLLVRERDLSGKILNERAVKRAELEKILKDPKIPVLIAGDKSVRYEAVLQVMDELRKAGVTRIGLQVKPGQ
jgi:biopolymer transport protein TolR